MPPSELAWLGNGIEALESVVTSIAGFALTPDSFEQTIGNVILLGGDTGTLAAMAGCALRSISQHRAIAEKPRQAAGIQSEGTSLYLETRRRAIREVRALSLAYAEELLMPLRDHFRPPSVGRHSWEGSRVVAADARRKPASALACVAST